jgi:hypothetical protein
MTTPTPSPTPSPTSAPSPTSTTIEPNRRTVTNPEEAMQRMVDELNLPSPDPDANLQLLNEIQLLGRFNDVTQELLEMGEALTPKSQKGRDLHSTRGACLVEMKRRRLR